MRRGGEVPNVHQVHDAPAPHHPRHPHGGDRGDLRGEDRNGGNGARDGHGERERARQRWYRSSQLAGSTMRYPRGSCAMGRMIPMGLEAALAPVGEGEAKADQDVRLEVLADLEDGEHRAGGGPRMGSAPESLGRGGTVAHLEHRCLGHEA